jgi:16S rRNA (cytidine1402-2'-O)-methyltransferase
MPGTLYVVATPLGNLEDMTFRAVRILREVALIAAEDTRHSRKLLAHFDIHTPLVSYFDHAEQHKAPRLIAELRAGKSIALICDAGTPGIADPGYRLVCAAVAAGVPVVPIPGPSAIVAALSVSGLPTDRFVFEGFVPARSSARIAFYRRLRGEERTTVCFETGRRLVASLGDLLSVLGPREVAVARELTKLFEAFVRGPAGAVLARLEGGEVRGEVTLLIGPGRAEPAERSEDEIRTALLRLRAEGVTLRESARRLAREWGCSRRDIYQIGLDLQRRDKGGG